MAKARLGVILRCLIAMSIAVLASALLATPTMAQTADGDTFEIPECWDLMEPDENGVVYLYLQGDTGEAFYTCMPEPIGANSNAIRQNNLSKKRPWFAVKVGSNINLTICPKRDLRGNCIEISGPTEVSDLKASEYGTTMVRSFRAEKIAVPVIEPVSCAFEPHRSREHVLRDCRGVIKRAPIEKGQADICSSHANGNCVRYNTGHRGFANPSRTTRAEVHASSNVRVQIFEDVSFQGRSEVLPAGYKGDTFPFKSFVLLDAQDEALEYRRTFAEVTEDAEERREEAARLAEQKKAAERAEQARLAQVDAERKAAKAKTALASNAASNGPAGEVVQPTSTRLRKVEFGQFTTLADVAVYMGEEQLTSANFRLAAPLPSMPSDVSAGYRAQRVDFGLTKDGLILFAPTRFGMFAYDNLNSRIIRPESEWGIKKIANPGIRNDQNSGVVYGLGNDGRLLEGRYYVEDGDVTEVQFVEMALNNRVVEGRYLDVQWHGNTLWLLTTDGKLRAYTTGGGLGDSDGWKDFSSLPKLKRIVITKEGDVFSLTDSGELLKSKTFWPARTTPVASNAHDFAVLDGSSVLHISSQTGKLMRGEREMDKTGTFTRFIGENACLLENGDGQVFECSSYN
ncbi:hypothetical protein GRI35_11770 [Altererythrobacter aestiaquae]|uniref:WG containing repeat-containing protein n=2 Tax=Pontixanthobacter aestiaquae TaxID=1509367 RepID=A0A844Z972_9SPHN|nr:hypothetical protein [Pontixanthobacter aestiaquae]MXO84044.1 hypothetical protein [Pontixanthobacter aestiaquae]